MTGATFPVTHAVTRGLTYPAGEVGFPGHKSIVSPSGTLNTAVAFTRSSTATYIGSDRLLHTAAANAPRFEYDPATGLYKGLLIEEARTNLLLNSGTLATQNVTVSATAYTLSFEGTGTVTLSGAATGSLVGTGTGPANRVSLTFTPTAGTLTLTVTGTCTNGQLEAGAFPTSYVPTTTATVTRAADVAQITDLSLIGFNASAGSVFAIVDSEYPQTTGFAGISGFSTGGLSPSGHIYFSNSYLKIYDGTNTAQIAQAVAANTQIKIAAGFGSTSIAITHSGYATSDTASTVNFVGSVNQMDVGMWGDGTNPLNGHIKELRYYPRRLSDAALQALTA